MKLEEAVARYIVWLKESGAGQGTMYQAAPYLRRFVTFANGRSVEEVEGVTVNLVEDYKVQLHKKISLATGKPLSVATVAGNLVCVKMFFRKMVEWGWSSSNPMLGFPWRLTPRYPRKAHPRPEGKGDAS